MKKVVAGNWKMNTTLLEGTALAGEILENLPVGQNVEIILAPPFTHIASISSLVKDKGVKVAGQDCSSEEKGAFTGEVSANMLASAGATHVIVGHSERRSYHKEQSDLLVRKMQSAWNAGLIPILCCGESLEERESGIFFETVRRQLEETIFTFSELPGKLIVAYEPVWAIGTGKTATKEQAGEMHAYISSLLQNHPDSGTSDIPILYGGSCNPANAEELFGTEHIDGGLIGGASLKANDFLKLIATAEVANTPC